MEGQAKWPGGLQEEASSLQTGLSMLPDEVLLDSPRSSAQVPQVSPHALIEAVLSALGSRRPMNMGSCETGLVEGGQMLHQHSDWMQGFTDCESSCFY